MVTAPLLALLLVLSLLLLLHLHIQGKLMFAPYRTTDKINYIMYLSRKQLPVYYRMLMLGFLLLLVLPVVVVLVLVLVLSVVVVLLLLQYIAECAARAR